MPQSYIARHPNHTAFGLWLDSNLPLPFLPLGYGVADLVIRYAGQIEPSRNPPAYSQFRMQPEDADWVCNYLEVDGHVLRFRIRSPGNYLSIQTSRTDIEDIFPFLMGPMMAAVLHRRGVPLLHGASVVSHGRAVLIAGESEMGKSTLAAMLVAAGLPLLTEDVTPLDCTGSDFRILPGYPRLQLHADAVQGLGFSLDECARVYPGFPADDKHWLDIYRLPGGFHTTPAPLQLIYILSGRRSDLDTPRVTPLPPTQACLALLEHLYAPRSFNIPPEQTLNLCARLAELVPVREVWTPEGLDRVAATAQALIEDASTI
jgi:hypothetical protein